MGLNFRLLAVGTVLMTTTFVSPLSSQARPMYEDMRMFSQVLNQIRINHPDSLNTHDLLMAAIQGMVSAADPHSYVMPAYRLSAEREELLRRGELYPIPIEFAYLADAPIVVSVHPGTEAAELGILLGDELVAIDDLPVSAESAAELEIILEGKKNSRVQLTFLRRRLDGSDVVLTRRVKREKVEDTPSVGAALMLDDLTGYIRLLHFDNENVGSEFRDSLNSLDLEGMQRLILDLRDNSGGLVREAASVASEFLPDNAIIYTAQGRKQEVNDTVRVERDAEWAERDFQLVVLVNNSTVSAAELVTGALQDHDRALIIGRPTFGKSLLMRGFPMTDGSAIVLVVGHLLTPCGRTIQRDYHGVRQYDYRRLAGALQDTVGRPSCETANGRTVYGGGGIYPDVMLDPPSVTPDWYLPIQDRDLILGWVGRYLADSTFSTTSAEIFAEEGLPEAAVENFIAYAESQGVFIPEDSEARDGLANNLMWNVLWGRWGAAGYYPILARRSRDVQAALKQFGTIDSLLNPN